MRITTLTLRNFRSHEDTILDLDRLNFVRGPNGCGKRSVQLALKYLFTGQCAIWAIENTPSTYAKYDYGIMTIAVQERRSEEDGSRFLQGKLSCGHGRSSGQA
ncbi:MAG: AAA family ATPase [Candidatus Acidiferrales bacterium]